MEDNTYECERCGGIFIIESDTDEKILCCPQCGNKKSTFYKVCEILDIEGD